MMEEIEEIDPGDDEEHWKLTEDFKDYSKSYESNDKLSWIWRKGLSLGMRMVVTGVVVSSASCVIPSVVVLSAMGFAVSIPAGFIIVTYSCGEKLLNTLLPMPLTLPYCEENRLMYSDEPEEYMVYRDGVDRGYEEDEVTEVEEREFEEDARKGLESRIELAEENDKDVNDHEQTSDNSKDDIVEKLGSEEDLRMYNVDEVQPRNSTMIPKILEGIEEAEKEFCLMQKEEGGMPRDPLREVIEEVENENNVEQGGYEDDLGEYMEAEISLMEKEEDGMPKDSLEEDVVEAQDEVGGENENDSEQGGYEEDLGEYTEQPLDSEILPELLGGIEETEIEISLMEKEEDGMRKDSLKEDVVEAQDEVGGENENDFEQGGYEEDLGEYTEVEEQPLDSEIFPEVLEGIEVAEIKTSLMEKEEDGMPKDSLREVVVEDHEVGEENENNLEQVMETMAFVSPRDLTEENDERKGNSTGIEEDELNKEMSGISGSIEEMRDEGIDDQKRKDNLPEETHEENEESERVSVKDVSQDKGDKDLTVIPEGFKEAEHAISLTKKKASEMPSDAVRAVAVELPECKEIENIVEQVTEDVAFVGGKNELNAEQVGRYDDDVEEHMEDEEQTLNSNIAPETIEMTKEAENVFSLTEKEEGGVSRNSLTAVVVEAQDGGEDEINIEQVTENMTSIIPPRDVKEEIGDWGIVSGLDESELRRETKGLSEVMGDKDMSDNKGNKNFTVIPEEPKLAMDEKGLVHDLKSDANVNNISIEGSKSGLMHKEPKSGVENLPAVIVKINVDHTVTEAYEETSSNKLKTLVFSYKDKEMTDESGFDWSDSGTVESDQFSDAFDKLPEGDDLPLYTDVEATVERHKVVIVSPMPISENVKTAPDEESAYSDKVKMDEDKIWEQINAMRTIVGYKNTPNPSCVEELKALYVFTGVEPPMSCNGPADLADIREKLQFLMSIVGVK